MAQWKHVPETVLDGLVAESKRILRPDSGIAYHSVEPGDHYTRDSCHISHYRYPEWIWSLLVKNSISYHTRLSVNQYVICFEKLGACISSMNNLISDRDLTRLNNGFALNKRFAQLPPEDLAVWYFEVI